MSSHSLPVSLRHFLHNSVGHTDSIAEKPTPLPSDEDVTTLVNRGDHYAFGQLSDRYLTTARCIALRIAKDTGERWWVAERDKLKQGSV